MNMYFKGNILRLLLLKRRKRNLEKYSKWLLFQLIILTLNK